MEAILDYIDDIKVSGDVFNSPNNEYWELVCLKDGLEALYKQAVKFDEAAVKAVNPDGKLQISLAGNVPALSHIPKALLTMIFHWYAISACQYVRVIGKIASKTDKEYIQQIIPDVLTFRNKVAAHYAWYSNPNDKRDNPAEKAISVMPKLSFETDSFHMMAFELGTKGYTTENLKPWSIVKVHEQLKNRYWIA